MTAGRHLGAAALLAASLLPWLSGTGNAAQTLDIELTKLMDMDGKCAASLRLTNHMTETLDIVRFDLYVFDKAGVSARHLILDTGPMHTDNTTVASLPLVDGPCSNIGRLVIKDVPECKTAAGADVDCVGALNLTSRTAAPLTK